MSTILIATDFSPTSRETVRQGLRLAKELGARIELVCVVPKHNPLFPQSPANRDAVALLEAQEAAPAMAALEKIAAKSPLSIRRTVLRGQPAEQLVEHAKRKRARFIVVGAHSQGIASTLLLGSTTHRVLRESSVPVLVVPPRSRGEK